MRKMTIGAAIAPSLPNRSSSPRRWSLQAAPGAFLFESRIGAYEAFPHHFLERQVRGGMRAPAADPVAFQAADGGRLLALAQRFRFAEHQPAETDDRHVGGREVLAGAVGDQALAVLGERVLLGNALHACEGAVLLVLAVDQVIVASVSQRDIARTELGE